MAGDWIKVEHATANKPEVLKMARMLGVSRREMVGILVDFLVWCDVNCVDGVVDAVVDADVDGVMSCPGLSAVLKCVGWAEFEIDPPAMRMSNWERHNGETSKKRALKNERQARWRGKNVDAPASTEASTREEKRRVLKPSAAPIRPPSTSKPVADKSALNGKTKPIADRWWTSDQGIDRKGRELGMTARGGESYEQFKARLFDVIAQRERGAA